MAKPKLNDRSQARSQGRKRIHDRLVQFKMPNGLFLVLRKEATRDGRTISNLLRKLVTDGLLERGAFAKNAIQ